MTNWTKQALIVLESRYLLRDTSGKVIETPDEMLMRVASHVALAEAMYGESNSTYWQNRFYGIMANLDFLPNSPCLANAGKPNGQLSACFVLPVEDSIKGIFDAIKNAALVHKTGGGTGFAFSRLRPRNAIVASTGQAASGPVAFMRVFDAATEAIKQGGMRRGANMGILRVDHPDVIEFINSKRSRGDIENFNISVAITDKFMSALDGDGVCYNGSEPYFYHLKGAGSGWDLLDAREVWNQICLAAWKTGDPGIVFIDRINAGRSNPVPNKFIVESTNPCGEQPLYPYESCILGSINLSKFVLSGNGTQGVDWAGLRRIVPICVRFLDDIIDVNCYPLPEIEKMTKDIRRIGLGVMGWADMLLMLGIAYDSRKALDLAKDIMKFIQHEAEHASLELAKERGAFPLFLDSIYKGLAFPGRRNATLTTIAPTGTISLIAGCSSGIEPVFAWKTTHHGLEGKLEDKEIMHPLFAQALARRDPGMATVFRTAHQINPEWHVKMQAAFQKHVDNAVSKTINMSNDSDVGEIDKAYRQAWAEGCKGVTVYRDQSKAGQTLTNTEEVQDDERSRSDSVGSGTTNPVSLIEQAIRPTTLPSVTIKQHTPFGNAYVTISEIDEGQPFEVFVTIGKAGSDVQAMSEALGRIISHTLRHSSLKRATLVQICGQLNGIGGSLSDGFGADRVRSVPDAIAKALGEYLKPSKLLDFPTIEDVWKNEHAYSFCPECGEMSVVHRAGCEECIECGYSRC